jgi:hypothetical protein
VLCDERLNIPGTSQDAFRLLFGYQPVQAPTRHTWLVEHRAAESRCRVASLNLLAALELL